MVRSQVLARAGLLDVMLQVDDLVRGGRRSESLLRGLCQRRHGGWPEVAAIPPAYIACPCVGNIASVVTTRTRRPPSYLGMPWWRNILDL